MCACWNCETLESPATLPNVTFAWLANSWHGAVHVFGFSAVHGDWTNPSGGAVCGCPLSGIRGSSPRREQGFLSLVNFVCCQLKVCVAEHLSKWLLQSLVCLSVILKPRKWGGSGPLAAVASWKKRVTDGFIKSNFKYFSSVLILRVIPLVLGRLTFD
jgi:hypothetical protein